MDDPKAQIMCALTHLKKIVNTAVKNISPFYITKPWGIAEQPDFINAVVLLETTLSPLKLIHVLQEIENKMGRKKVQRNGPRVIDLDIIFYDNFILNHDDLTLPHPRYSDRAFVLQPLFDIAPQLILPNGQQLRDHLATLDLSTITRIETQ
jgi:2-amino-4-hydroxy-6-hydroxymethyldihydropteridine diphosphokinase